MSTFRRTNSGLNNQHLFFNVDYILFLEGGSNSYNKLEVYANKYNSETEDIIFWRNIFGEFVKDKKIKFKSIGSKKTIKEIASDIISGEIKTIILAMDNEFDEILNKRIEHPQIYYTYGYSWENDVWNENVISYVIEEITAIKMENDDITLNFQQFTENIKVAVNADGYFFEKGNSFFPRPSGYLFCVDCKPVDLPLIKIVDIKARLNTKGIDESIANEFGDKHSIETLKFCYGHLLADYSCQLIMHYIKKRHSLQSIPKDIIYRIGINKYFQKSFKGGEIYEYYLNQFKKNVA